MTGVAEASALDVRIGVRREVSRFRRRWSTERLALYRKHLQTSVNEATPLVGVVAREAGVDLREALSRLQPPYGWPDERGKGRLDASLDRHLWRGRGVGHDLAGIGADRVAIVRSVLHPGGALMLRVQGAALEVTARIGAVTVRTARGCVSIRLPLHLPAVVSEAAVGRPAAVLVGHPWFADEAWVVERVTPVVGGASIIKVSAANEAFVMPWGRLLGRGCIDG